MPRDPVKNPRWFSRTSAIKAINEKKKRVRVLEGEATKKKKKGRSKSGGSLASFEAKRKRGGWPRFSKAKRR